MKRIFEGNPKDYWVNDDVHDDFVHTLETWDKQERGRIISLRKKLKSEGISGRCRNLIGKLNKSNQNQK